MKCSNIFPIPKTSRSEDLKFRDKESVKTFHKNLYTFCIYWFLIKLQNTIRNQIHFNTFGGGAYKRIFCCLQVDGRIIGGGAYERHATETGL